MTPTRFLLLTLWISANCPAQDFPPKDYPRSYFRDPLPVAMHLAANFGELRENHYHMGLDIRTEHRENLPVVAAAEGYISRIKVEPFGFGQAIYLTHPNGYTTVYAHLNAFMPALADFVKQQQYDSASWKITLVLPPGLFAVKKGDLIAYSGNTGGSQGPHLHFEIRRTRDDINLNPLLFGLPVDDDRPPVIRRLALYDRARSIYEQSPAVYDVRGSGNQYAVEPAVLLTAASDIGFGISAFDTQSGSANPNGIYKALVYDNGDPVCGFQLDAISYDETRDINAHIDYRSKALSGISFQQLFELPGYTHSVYRNFRTGGRINISDGKLHSIRILVKDAYGNMCSLTTSVQYRPVHTTIPVYEGKPFYPFMLDGFETTDCSFYLGERTLYDSVHISYSSSVSTDPGALSRLHRIGKTDIPVRDSILVRIRPTAAPGAFDKTKVVMQWQDKGHMEVKKVTWLGNWATAAFREFGTFRLLSDSIPPVISFPGLPPGANLEKASRLVVLVKDNLERIKSFSGRIDGNWILFSNDKEKAFIYSFDSHCVPGKHELVVEALDEAGNLARKSLFFTR
jgi:Peptidase family M23